MKHTGKYMHEVFGGHSQHDSLTTAQLQHTWHRLAHAGTHFRVHCLSHQSREAAISYHTSRCVA